LVLDFHPVIEVGQDIGLRVNVLEGLAGSLADQLGDVVNKLIALHGKDS
jgi:hypothetical protein